MAEMAEKFEVVGVAEPIDDVREYISGCSEKILSFKYKTAADCQPPFVIC